MLRFWKRGCLGSIIMEVEYFPLPTYVIEILSACKFMSRAEPVEPQLIRLLIYAMFLVGLIVFVSLSYIPAAYGRYTGHKSIFFFCIPARLAWFLQEFPAFAVPVLFLALEYQRKNLNDLNVTKLALIGMFVLHYWQRVFIYSLSIKGGKSTPIGICALAFLFCTVNGYIQVRSIQLQQFDKSWLQNPSFVVGAVIFICGLVVNIHSDHILRNLRAPGETGYKIPNGGLFKYVTAANYFGETVEWFGFFLAVQTLASAAFSFFTFANLFPRALSHHRWYQQKFEDYPTDRKALIPFLL